MFFLQLKCIKYVSCRQHHHEQHASEYTDHLKQIVKADADDDEIDELPERKAHHASTGLKKNLTHLVYRMNVDLSNTLPSSAKFFDEAAAAFESELDEKLSDNRLLLKRQKEHHHSNHNQNELAPALRSMLKMLDNPTKHLFREYVRLKSICSNGYVQVRKGAAARLENESQAFSTPSGN